MLGPQKKREERPLLLREFISCMKYVQYCPHLKTKYTEQRGI